MPTAVKINDPNKYPEKLRNRLGIFRGDRYWRVQAQSVDQAIFADGLPSFGAPWNAELPLVQLVEIVPRAEQPGGDWWILTLTYESDTGVQHVPEDGLELVTEIEQVSTTERAYVDLDCKKIGKDGQGTGKLLTAINFKIITYSEALPDIEALLNLSDDPKINASAVTLKNILGSGVNWEVPAGQLRYSGFSIGREGELFQVVHKVDRRRSWIYEQRKNDLQGDCVGEVEERRIYEEADFVAAFGG